MQETQLFPKASSSSPTMGTPLYLRLENNYIAEVCGNGVIEQFCSRKLSVVQS